MSTPYMYGCPNLGLMMVKSIIICWLFTITPVARLSLGSKHRWLAKEWTLGCWSYWADRYLVLCKLLLLPRWQWLPNCGVCRSLLSTDCCHTYSWTCSVGLICCMLPSWGCFGCSLSCAEISQAWASANAAAAAFCDLSMCRFASRSVFLLSCSSCFRMLSFCLCSRFQMVDCLVMKNRDWL